jgi:hypothetical protein
MRQAITDISHLAIGGSKKKSRPGRDILHTTVSDFDSQRDLRTSVSDLFSTDSESFSFGVVKPESCVIRCTDIMQHIRNCPVCSKLYKPVKQSHPVYDDCVDGNCNLKTYNQPKSTMNNEKNVNVMLIGMFLIIILLLIKILFNKQD